MNRMPTDASPPSAAATILRGLAQPAGLRALVRPVPAARPLGEGPGFRPAAADERSLEKQPVTDDAAEPLQSGAEGEGQAWQRAYSQGLAAGREEARQAGFEQGLQQGLAEGRVLGASEVERGSEALRAAAMRQVELLAQWADALKAQTAQHLAQRFAAAEDDMVGLCHAAICRLLGEHALKPQAIHAAVRRGIEECCGASLKTLLAVHVHADDLALLQADPTLAQWLATEDGADVVWRADSTVALGGCLVRSTHGHLDARLETQLAALTQALQQQRHEGRLA